VLISVSKTSEQPGKHQLPEKRIVRAGGRDDFVHALVFLGLSEHESLGRAMQGWEPVLAAPLSADPTVGLFGRF